MFVRIQSRLEATARGAAIFGVTIKVLMEVALIRTAIGLNL